MKAFVMNARVLLLVLVTGLFMAAWDGDQAAMEAAIVRRDARIADARIALLQRQAGETQTASLPTPHTNTGLQHALTVAQVSESPARSAADNNVSIQPADVPLPLSIAAGSYQAINQTTGESTRLSIDEASASSSNQRDFYTVDGENGDRWYLIRIANQPTTPAL